MNARTIALLACLLPLAACATTPVEASGGERGDMAASPPAGTCQADPARQYVGQRASSETGAAILQATGATNLRWVPPDTAVTMDFRPDRVTVSYDRDSRIERISCG